MQRAAGNRRRDSSARLPPSRSSCVELARIFLAAQWIGHESADSRAVAKGTSGDDFPAAASASPSRHAAHVATPLETLPSHSTGPAYLAWMWMPHSSF